MIAPKEIPTSFFEHPLMIAKAKQPQKESCVIEIGPGLGEFLMHLAAQNSDTHVIGIELRYWRYWSLLKKYNKSEASNVSLIRGDARLALPVLTKQHKIEKIYIQFPDPWPKRRHSSYRLMQPEFVDLCFKSLTLNGELIFTTDSKDYAEQVASLVKIHTSVHSVYGDAIVTEAPDTKSSDAFPSAFYQRWKKMGRTIYYQRYKKD